MLTFEAYGRMTYFLHVLISGMANMLKRDEQWANRTGVGFCVADARTGQLMFGPTLVGQPDPAKREKYLALCREKAKRLAEHPGHISSWQSRDPDRGMWGGAVRVGELILSTSGLPEFGDEALMLVIALNFLPYEEGMEDELAEIAEASGNPYWGILRFLDVRTETE